MARPGIPHGPASDGPAPTYSCGMTQDADWARRVLQARTAGPVRRVDHRRGADGRDAAQVWAAGDLVLKLHAAGADRLADRLAVVAEAPTPDLLTPLESVPAVAPSGRLATLWPRVRPVDPDTARAYPWHELGRLLAGLHSCPPDPRLPVAGPDPRPGRAVARLPAAPERRLLEAVLAAAVEPREEPAGEDVVLHGDAHLGQLGEFRGRWVLLDIDDLAVGDPVLDLARPAALWATGILPTRDWQGLLDGYRAVRPRGIPADSRLWKRLDRPARLALVTLTARALRIGRDPEATRLLLAACARAGGGPSSILDP